jgi:hypothetical protein
LQLLGDVEAVEKHHGRRLPRSRRIGIGMHEKRRQTGVLVRHLDDFDARAAHHARRFFEDRHRPRVDIHAPRRSGMDEALAGLVVTRGAQKAGCGGQLMAGAQGVATALLDLVAHPRPFFKPGGVVADLAGKRAPDAVDFIDLDPRPRRTGEAYQEPHRPTVIVREVKKCGILPILRHDLVPLARGLSASAPSVSGLSISGPFLSRPHFRL